MKALMILFGLCCCVSVALAQDDGPVIPDDVPEPYSLALSPVGDKLAVGYFVKGALYGSGRPGVVTVWDLNTDEIVARLDRLAGAVSAVTFSADGSMEYLNIQWSESWAQEFPVLNHCGFGEIQIASCDFSLSLAQSAKRVLPAVATAHLPSSVTFSIQLCR